MIVRNLYKKYSILIVFLLIIAFFASSVCFIFIRSNAFPIINGLILLSFLFLFRGKYRAYAFIFFSSFTKCMMLINTRIGSFLTWNMLAYIVVVLIERLIAKKQFTSNEKTLITFYLVFVITAILADIFNINNVSILKSISALSYLSIPIVLSLDMKANKEIKIILFVFSLSIIAMNVFAFVFVYIFKQFTSSFLAVYLPKHIAQMNYNSSNYRFSGLTGDPNHNSLYIVIAISLNLIYSQKTKRKTIFIHIMNCIMAFFGLVGQSKTFLLALIIGFFVIMLDMAKDKKNLSTVLIVSSATIVCGMFLFISIPFLSNVLLRFINIDTRVGFLESITTQRLHIWKNYLSYISSDPLRIVFGHGVWPTEKLFDWDYHNFYIQIIWEFGLFGTFAFFGYMFKSVKPTFKEKKISYTLPIIMLVFYGFSLHILYDEFIYSALYLYKRLIEEYEYSDSILVGDVKIGEYHEIKI